MTLMLLALVVVVVLAVAVVAVVVVDVGGVMTSLLFLAEMILFGLMISFFGICGCRFLRLSSCSTTW